MQEKVSSGHMATIIRIRCIFLHNYLAEYEYTIQPTIPTEQNTNRIFGTALLETAFYLLARYGESHSGVTETTQRKEEPTEEGSRHKEG